MDLLKLLSTSEIVAQAVSFLILFFIVRAFAWKRFLNLLEDRRGRIAAELKKIDDERAAAAKVRAEYEERIGRIEDEVKERLREATLEGQRITEEIRAAARTEAEKIIESARGETRHEIALAKEKLKDEVVDLVLSATGTLLEEKITDAEDRRIVEGFIQKLDTVA